jgi:hypothetical protein
MVTEKLRSVVIGEVTESSLREDYQLRKGGEEEACTIPTIWHGNWEPC